MAAIIKQCERCAASFEAADKRDYYCADCMSEIFREIREQNSNEPLKSGGKSCLPLGSEGA
jgi:DNA-directed RNA polymerase subunit RPC12/RpoP